MTNRELLKRLLSEIENFIQRKRIEEDDCIVQAKKLAHAMLYDTLNARKDMADEFLNYSEKKLSEEYRACNAPLYWLLHAFSRLITTTRTLLIMPENLDREVRLLRHDAVIMCEIRVHEDFNQIRIELETGVNMG
jgi:hypothetical protein